MLLCLPFFYFCGQINFVWTVVLCQDPIVDKNCCPDISSVSAFFDLLSAKKNRTVKEILNLCIKKIVLNLLLVKLFAEPNAIAPSVVQATL